MFPGNMASRDPCSRETWCKPRDTMHLRRFFGLTTVLGRSIHILCCCIMDNDTNLLHLFRDIKKQILNCQPRSTLKNNASKLCNIAQRPSGNSEQLWDIIFQCVLGNSQYLYNTEHYFIENTRSDFILSHSNVSRFNCLNVHKKDPDNRKTV